MTHDARQMLGRVPLFAPFSAAELDSLYACSSERTMISGETLFQRGDPGDSMMVILAGEVRIVLPGVEGSEQDLSVLEQGAVFGEIALFDGKPRSADAVAATNGRLLVVERAATMRLIAQDPHFAARVIEIICARLRSTLAQFDAMRFQDTGERIMIYLLQRSEGRENGRIDITQNALSRAIGSTRETVNRRLRKLAALELIEISPGRITVRDRDGLTAIIRERTHIF